MKGTLQLLLILIVFCLNINAESIKNEKETPKRRIKRKYYWLEIFWLFTSK